MLVFVGYLIVCAAVFGGFVLAGGHIASLLQPDNRWITGQRIEVSGGMYL